MSVNVTAGHEAGLPFEEIPRRRIPAAKHGPAGGDAVKGQERKPPQAVRVLGAVLLLMPQEQCVGSGDTMRRPVQDYVPPQRKRACMGELPVVPGSDQKPPRPGGETVERDAAATASPSGGVDRFRTFAICRKRCAGVMLPC